ncbi:hypothetical protein G9F32_03150 [Acinetobacter sp. 194]|uniref:hypothetical protein n=1 Tax=Acinetobacter shaoyimingii TaxID=2715164 RepID=UPI0014099851|nr:hypothetical protein [Acinetobacter shaoyimingii]NHB57030.1 hypothetical protein [Acinetobacter shaoyimingii]
METQSIKIFGIMISDNFSKSDIKNVVNAKVKRTQEIAIKHNISIVRASILSQEELMSAINVFDEIKKQKFLSLFKLEQDISVIESQSAAVRADDYSKAYIADSVENEIKDAHTWNYIYWVVIALFALGCLAYAVK